MTTHLAILVFLILLCLLIKDEKKRYKFLLPISFLVVTIYMGIRYDYGLDYWSYYYSFDSESDELFRRGERYFIKLLRFFPYYYQFILFQSVVVIGFLFWLVKRKVSPNVYIVFFILLFTMNGMIFNMMSALRSTFAACFIWMALEYGIFSGRRLVIYYSLVTVALLFHTSAVVFYVLPVFFFVKNLNLQFAIVSLAIANISSQFLSTTFFRLIVQMDALSMYAGYTDTIENATIFGIIHKGIWLIPAYYILKYAYEYKGQSDYNYFLVTYLYFLLFFLGTTFQERFTTYLFPFVIVALSKAYNYMINREKWYCILPILIVCVYNTYLFYYRMATHYISYPGNYMEYKTIFEAPHFPF